MGRRERRIFERRIVLGAGLGVIVALGFLLFLGVHARRSQTRLPARPDAPALPAGLSGPLAGVTVILDPGHGGQDPGTTCGPLSEASLTYRTAVELAACLRAQGAAVTYTVRSRALDPALAVTEPTPMRPTDAVMAATGRPLRLRHSPRPLWQRADWAQPFWARQVKSDPDAARDVFFVSLHYDQDGVQSVSGSVVCVDRRDRRLPALASALAAQMATDHFERHDHYRGRRGVSGHELGVLDPKHNPVPETVLLELAMLSNPQDALQASDPVWRLEMARRITQAILQVHQQKEIPRTQMPRKAARTREADPISSLRPARA